MNYCCRTIVTLLLCFFMLNGVKAQDWQKKGTMPGPERDHPVGFAINDTGYVLTGMTQNAQGQNLILNDFYRYIPEEDRWETLSNFPGGHRGFSIGIAHQGKGYIGFGAGSSGYLNDLWEYDPKTDEWTQLEPCPCSGRRHPALEALNGKLYVGLGDDNNGNLADWWEYDIESDSWTQRPDIPGSARHHPFHFSVNGYVYAGMGHGNQGAIYDDWYRYDPTDSSWTEMDNFPGQGRVAGTQFAHAGKGYVLSGDGNNHSYMDTGEFWSYDPEADEWTEEDPHPGVSRWAPSNFVANDQVFMVGGLNRKEGVRYNDLWAYDLDQTTSKEVPTVTNQSFKVYPNPVQQKLHFPDKFEANHVELLNANGQVLRTQFEVNEHLNVANLSTGLYLLRVRDDKGNWHQTRFIKE